MFWLKFQHNYRDNQGKDEAGRGVRRTLQSRQELMSVWTTIAAREEVKSVLILDLSPHCITKLEICIVYFLCLHVLLLFVLKQCEPAAAPSPSQVVKNSSAWRSLRGPRFFCFHDPPLLYLLPPGTGFSCTTHPFQLGASERFVFVLLTCKNCYIICRAQCKMKTWDIYFEN